MESMQIVFDKLKSYEQQQGYSCYQNVHLTENNTKITGEIHLEGGMSIEIAMWTPEIVVFTTSNSHLTTKLFTTMKIIAQKKPVFVYDCLMKCAYGTDIANLGNTTFKYNELARIYCLYHDFVRCNFAQAQPKFEGILISSEYHRLQGYELLGDQSDIEMSAMTFDAIHYIIGHNYRYFEGVFQIETIHAAKIYGDLIARNISDISVLSNQQFDILTHTRAKEQRTYHVFAKDLKLIDDDRLQINDAIFVFDEHEHIDEIKNKHHVP